MTVTKMIALLYTMPEHTEVLAWDLPALSTGCRGESPRQQGNADHPN
jgi:hypothetical protein